jgi:hypothetical protein
MSTNLCPPPDAQYLVDSILVISEEYEIIMGEFLTDRIRAYLQGHGIQIPESRPDLLSDVPPHLLTDLRRKMVQIMEGSEVRKRLQESPPDYGGEEEYSFTFDYAEDDDCDDF